MMMMRTIQGLVKGVAQWMSQSACVFARKLRLLWYIADQELICAGNAVGSLPLHLEATLRLQTTGLLKEHA